MVCILVINTCIIIHDVIGFSSDLLTAITNDAIQGISRVSGSCTPRTVGGISTNDEAVQPRQAIAPPNRALIDVNTNISSLSSFCFLVTARTDTANTNPFFRIFNSTGMQIGSLTATQNNVTLNLFSSTATFDVDFTGSNFRQFQICVDSNRASLYDGCVQASGTGTVPFSTTEFSSREAELAPPASIILFQNFGNQEGRDVYQVEWCVIQCINICFIRIREQFNSLL